MKKILSIMLMLIISFVSAIQVYSAETKEQFSRVFVNMPEIVVELKGTDFDVSDLSTVNASLGEEKLTVKDFHNYTPTEDSSKVYMLIDVSGSAKTYISNIKSYIEDFVSCMGEKDKLVLVTFGTEVKTILDESRDSEEINEAVEAIECNDDYTMLYDALNTVYNDSVSSTEEYTREYAIVFTDCKNDKTVSVTENELLANYSDHQLPLYVSAPSNADKSDISVIGKIARASGGDIATVDSSSEFKSFTDEIDKVSIVKLEAESNYASGEEKNLSLSFDTYSYNINVVLSKYKHDTESPKVKSFTYDSKNNTFIVAFTEKVTDPTVKEYYSISDSDGIKWEIESIDSTLEQDDEARLVMKEQIVNGEYKITFKGITDCSKEKNELTDSASCEVNDATVLIEDSEFPVLAIIIILVALVLIVGAVVFILILKSNKRFEKESNIFSEKMPVQSSCNEYNTDNQVVQKHHIKTSDAIRIRMKVKTGKVSEQIIETSIVSSIIIGRSSACDIYIDDTKLSRQHFVIEHINSELYITDLESKNGTFINGIRISNRRKIVNGDKIFAGLSEIVINYVK